MLFRFTAVVFLACSAYAQSDTAPAFRVQSVSGFAQYYSTAPRTVLPGILERNTVAAGAGMTVSYSRYSDRSGMSLSYTPTYVSSSRGVQGNTGNHTLTLTGRTSTNSRLSFTYSASGMVSLTSDVLFTPSELARLAAASAGKPADLGSALLTGGSTNNEISSVLAQAPGAGSPVDLTIFGERMWGISALAGVRYAYTPRLSVYMNLSAARNQSLNNTVLPETSGASLIRYTLSGSARTGFEYLLSPRTTVGVDLETTRAYSRIQDGYGSAASVSLSRAMGRSWFVNLHAGVGVINMIRSTPSIRGGAQPAGGARLGYSTYSNTFFISAERLAGDSYALGRSTTLVGAAAWRWSRPANPWAFSCDVTAERLSGAGIRPFNAHRGLVSLERRLAGHFFVAFDYAYLSRSLTAEQSLWAARNVHTGRVSVVWEPYGVRRGGS